MWEYDGHYLFLKDRELGGQLFTAGMVVNIKRSQPHSTLFYMHGDQDIRLPLHQKALEKMVELQILKKI